MTFATIHDNPRNSRIHPISMLHFLFDSAIPLNPKLYVSPTLLSYMTLYNTMPVFFLLVSRTIIMTMSVITNVFDIILVFTVPVMFSTTATIIVFMITTTTTTTPTPITSTTMLLLQSLRNLHPAEAHSLRTKAPRTPTRESQLPAPACTTPEAATFRDSVVGIEV